MLKRRITQRIKGYKKISNVCLSKCLLKFNKVSKDGSAKANIIFTENEDDIVWGVLGEISYEAKKALDKFEGKGYGYIDKEVEITIEGNKYNVLLYIAEANYTNDELKPYDWYKNLVLAGCTENNFPNDYRKRIEKITSKKDGKKERRQKWMKLLL